MAIIMKQFIDQFKAMEKVANETLAANPAALVGIDSLPGSEHDEKVPEEAKKPDEEVTQGMPADATSTAGAVAGGDTKPLNEGKLEMDEPLLNAEKKPLVTDDALTAKVANEHLSTLVKDLLSDIHVAQKQANYKKQNNTNMNNKITLDDNTISKLAAAQAAYMLGREAAAKNVKQASAVNEAAIARQLIKAACVKAAQEQGLDPAAAEAAANNAMAVAGATGADVAAPEAAVADAAAQLPEDVTEEEVAEAIVDLVDSGELDPDTAKAIVDEIAEPQASEEDQAAEIIAQGIANGEITPEQAQEIAEAIDAESSAEAQGAADAEAAVQAAQDEAQGAADAEAAIQDAQDEAQGAADAEAALKQASAMYRGNAFSKVAAAIDARRQNRQAQQMDPATARYIEGFRKQAQARGVDPAVLAKYCLNNK